MKKSISEFLVARKAEVAYRTDRTQATFGGPQLSASPEIFDCFCVVSGVPKTEGTLIFTGKRGESLF